MNAITIKESKIRKTKNWNLAIIDIRNELIDCRVKNWTGE